MWGKEMKHLAAGPNPVPEPGSEAIAATSATAPDDTLAAIFLILSL